MGQIIISIGREFGSGGHESAEIIANKLGIKMYDRNILDEIAKEKSIENHEVCSDCRSIRCTFCSQCSSADDGVSNIDFWHAKED